MNSASALDPALLKPQTVTNVTLHWYSRGIQFRAAEAPQICSVWSGHSCALGVIPVRSVVSDVIQSRNTLHYSLRPRSHAGSCAKGVPVCI